MKTKALYLSLFAAIAISASAGIVEDSGIKGGLVVQIGCGDAREMAALRLNDSYLVQVLDTDSAKVKAARKQLRVSGQYGKVSVASFDGTTLPYADNMVNLIVVSGVGCQVSGKELERVLTPNGVAVVPEAGNKKILSRIPHPTSHNLSSVASGEGRIGTGFVKFTKPVPPEIDDWSHFLQGPDNNAVALDSVVGTPRGLKWVCRPLWSRSHEFLSSLCAMVSANGRIYYIADEGVISITDGSLPERWTLIARDAFNGLLLWKMPLPEWGSKTWRAKALRSTPKLAPKRIVAGGGKLFVPIGYSSSVSAIDAATGKALATYDNTSNVQEMRYLDGILLVMTKGRLTAINVDTGEATWEEQGVQQGIIAASDGKAFYQKDTVLLCSGLKDGKKVWQLDMQSPIKQLLVQDEYLLAGAEKTKAIASESGKILWESSVSISRGLAFIANNQFFIGTTGRDIQTGEVKTKVDASDVHTPGHHARCYPGKACKNFLITPNRGAEFVSLTGGTNTQNDWLRGPCTFGILPCNGLLYSPPNPCFCYPGVKLPGFNAFAARGMNEAPGGETRATDPARLEKGEAYDQRSTPNAQRPTSKGIEWSTYRGDGRRTGASGTKVAADLSRSWTVKLAAPLTQPVVVGGKVSIVSKDTHTLHVLTEKTGKESWAYTASGRIDSPPTVYGDLVLFGSADGRVHCLKAEDGALVWRFRAASSDRQIMAFGQLESPWRVHGTVLVENGVAYFTAGRSTNLDGGILVFGLEIATGKVLYHTCLNTWARTREDAVDKPFIPGYHMEGAFSDILTSEGGYIYLGQYKFDMKLNQQDAPYVLADPDNKSGAMGMEELLGKPFTERVETQKRDEVRQRDWQLNKWPRMDKELKEKYGGSNLGDRKMGRHVFATGGFLDDSWYNRTFWMYSETWPGFYIANRAAKTGQIISVDDKKTYALQAFPHRNLQSPLFSPAKKGYLLFADDNDNEPVIPDYTRGVPKGIGFTRKDPPVWHQWIDIRARSMVATADTLFIAGAPDVLEDGDPMAAFEGRKGAILRAVSKETGEKLSENKLDSLPVFDGMSAADGKLFIALENGNIECWE